MNTVDMKDILLFNNHRRQIKKEDLDSLTESISETGLLSPVTIAKNFTGSKERFILVAGNRRYMACQNLGHTKIRVSLINTVEDESDLRFANLHENIHRSNTTPFEQGSMIQELIDEGFTVKAIAARLKMKVSYVKNCINVYSKIPKKWQNKIVKSNNSVVETGKIGIGTAMEILKTKNTQKLNSEVVEKLYDAAAKGKVNSHNLKAVALLLKKYSIDDALKAIDNVTITRPYLGFRKKDVDDIVKKHNKCLNKIIADILNGKIQDKIATFCF